MKVLSLALISVLTMTLAGCGGGGMEKVTLDTSVITGPFAGNAQVDAAASQLEAGDFGGGLNALVEVAKTADMTDEQIDGLYAIMTQVQQIMAQDPDKDNDAAWTATRSLDQVLAAKAN